MRNFLILLICFFVLSFDAVAKRDFAVFNELRCNGKMCYDKESDLPFSGELRSFYDNGVVRASIEYKNGLRDGASNFYYLNGNEKRQEVYIQGQIHGMLTEYYDNGNLKYEVSYDNGKLNGAFRAYYDDGQLKIDEEYVDGKKEGRARKFSTTGDLRRDAFYSNGVLIKGDCIYSDGKRNPFTQKMIDAYNNEGIVPCDFEKLVTF